MQALARYLDAARRLPPLTRDEERELATLARAGDAAARDELVRRNLPLVVSFARKQRRGAVRLEELVQEGNLGLLRAVEKFDPDAGTRFSTYAVWWIRAYVWRYLQAARSAVRPKSGTVARADLSLDSPLGDEADVTFLEQVEDDEPSPDARYAVAEEDALLRGALERARSDLGGLDLVVNAVSASRPPGGGPFGGGPVADATLEGYRGWGGAVAEQAFVFLSEGARALRAAGGGTLVQVTGGSARRAMGGRGLWASGAAGARALTHAAAQELRGEGIHVALLIVDATIESPKTAGYTQDQPRDALADQADIARAVEYLALQTARGLTHELVLTPAGDRWLP
jgi:RNA polymerase primary sigma factor